MRWQAAADFGFAVPLGAFIGPDEDGHGQWSGRHLPTADLIIGGMTRGSRPVVTDDDRRQAAADLAVWRADVVVLGPHEYHETLKNLLTRLLGPPREVDDVLLWDVDPATGAVLN